MDTRLKRQLIYGLLLLFVLGILRRADAETALNIATAANFGPALELISKRFTEQTGIPVQLTISSSGRLYAQIQHKAPFDLYFSADSKRPEMLHDDGLCEKPVRYTTGKVVLWSRKKDLCRQAGWEDIMNSDAVKKIAMANPRTAPYGTIALQATSELSNQPEIERKIVYGNNVGQAFQYAATGIVDAAFIAQSLALGNTGKKGCSWEIQGAQAVEQNACVLSYSSRKETAARLLELAISNEIAATRDNSEYR